MGEIFKLTFLLPPIYEEYEFFFKLYKLKEKKNFFLIFMCGQQNNGTQTWPCPNPRTWKHVAPTWQKADYYCRTKAADPYPYSGGPNDITEP